jgi:hypothetical protein
MPDPSGTPPSNFVCTWRHEPRKLGSSLAPVFPI